VSDKNLPVSDVEPTAPAVQDDPLWYKDAIIYQAHVKSFFDSSNDGIGDFPGMTQKLDYLQDLGITCLWILPFFPSPLKDDGYDIADYRDVNPSYGTLDDVKTLVRSAHDRNIKIVIELVVNHTSDQHPWFRAACQAPPGSPEREIYVWNDDDRKYPETRIIFCDTEKSNWTYDPVAKQYYWHRFFSHQPDLNHNNPAVVDRIIDVMKFWLEIGVDGMRLDAVPYLCVREGTSNENLPETHAVLRRVRRELDATFKNRMLLAEANQWPADVRPYFGDGDECHMAFHFPLMPRMFMALKQEDRHPITEIMGQTPDIPDSCQWALFLRNHDELTLEMVTDEERDYMYRAYTADPQMRLNLGIRRRLAPLVENSRRRIELMNLLLFSLPGTPIVYYGDELGMGDNIYLGDRNGVRTPMQWNGDRNGGFSRADPARLYAPPIMDPVYGYQAINVESQERYPGSLLNWMKRLIAMRKQHPVLGRGTIEFIGGPNRKILAYVRQDERETILVVANLSRSVQPVELDISTFSGLIPTEMAGLTPFPRIGKEPYFLSLGSYAAYWFSLERTLPPLQQLGLRTALNPEAELIESLPDLLMGVEWEGVLSSATRQVLERKALVPFLTRQRWFASKSRTIRRAQFADWTMIRPGSNPAYLAIVSVDYVDDSSESYLVPMAFASNDQASAALKEQPAAILSRVTGARKGVLMDGLLDDDTCSRILGLVEEGRKAPTERGLIRGADVSEPIDLPGDHRWVRGGIDQSNSVAFVNDRYVLKLFRRLESGPNPEFEILRFLSKQGFTRIPRLTGGLLYERSGFEADTLGIAQPAVVNQGSGWQFTIDELRRYYESVSTHVHADRAPDVTIPPTFESIERWYVTSVQTLGRRTAELHLALARGEEPAFKPEPLESEHLEQLANQMTARANRVFDHLQSRLDTLASPVREQADIVLSKRARLVAALEAIRKLTNVGMQTRIHGDYHLGQVLRTEDDFVILDFEGEPARSLNERTAKQSPLRDVAGMMRSFSYAAYAALFTMSVQNPEQFTRLEPWADAWQDRVAKAFRASYRKTIKGSPVAASKGFSPLLRAFIIEKSVYELGYELNNRPDWVRIPLIGLLKLL
jgi:maltose alpha-D-glucosyltransferase/alpha-amylase